MAVSEPLRRSSTQVRIVAVEDGVHGERPDTLATEEPMEIRVAGPGQELQPVAVTMRTPGGDFELAVGFLFTEGLIGPGDVRRVAYCDNLPGDDQRYNVVSVLLERAFDATLVHRNFCGDVLLWDLREGGARRRRGPVRARSPPGRRSRPMCSSRCRPASARSNGSSSRRAGLHAAGLFTAEGEPVTVREDVGRHNAVDKVIGERLLAGVVPLSGHILQVSGRLSFEIVQKAAVAGIPIVSAVSAPTSLAVEAGERFGMTIVGFVRDGRLNVYAGSERVV